MLGASARRWAPRAAFAAGALLASLLAWPSRAGAEGPWRGSLQIVGDSTEVGVSLGYLRVPGDYAASSAIDLREGLGVGLAAGYRTPRWSVQVAGQYADIGGSADKTLYTVGVGPEFAYHLAPSSDADVWLAFSAAYLATHSEEATAFGFEVGRLWAGVDIAPAGFLAIGPFASLALDVYPWIEATSEGDASFWYPSVFAGIQGRFEIDVASIPD